MTEKKWILLENGIDTRNGKAKLGGWSRHDLFYYETKIGTLYCGYPETNFDWIKFEMVPECKNTRLNIFMREDKFNEITKEISWDAKKE